MKVRLPLYSQIVGLLVLHLLLLMHSSCLSSTRSLAMAGKPSCRVQRVKKLKASPGLFREKRSQVLKAPGTVFLKDLESYTGLSSYLIDIAGTELAGDNRAIPQEVVSKCKWNFPMHRHPGRLSQFPPPDGQSDPRILSLISQANDRPPAFPIPDYPGGPPPFPMHEHLAVCHPLDSYCIQKHLIVFGLECEFQFICRANTA